MFSIFMFMFLGAAAWALIVRLMRRCADLESQLDHVCAQRTSVVDFLNRFTRMLSAVTEIDEAMQLVAHYLRDMMRAESLAIFVVDTDPHDGQEKMRGSAVAGVFPAFHRTADVVMTRPK